MTAGSILSRQSLGLPREAPDGWPRGGERLWATLRAHLDGVGYAEMGRREGVSAERIRSRCYQAMAEWRRLGAQA